jgi:hypothetical protein
MAEPANNRTSEGRFAPGTSGNPGGRAKGSYSRSTQLARLLLARNAGPLVRKCIEQAMAGDGVALRLVVERLAPIPRAGSIRIDLPPIKALDDIGPAMARVIGAAAAGEIALDDADRLIALLDKQRIALETPDLELRLRELEAAYREIANAQVVGPRGSPRPNGRDG